ncbi:curli production assembly/transport protein CsgG [Massilia violaceinigra]|uniref:Curli production assembly/transport protein CsgG n=1 Tax=Massilia violaceinigra TaxID=2045208 RepID=A0A2D2DJ90_9BURK|nr:CsgG/HfaB family protein [Massilia violaceinigra]ATQ75053.1 curli production assembly/transport protein CsgG [Massilia violaceinigra]
MNALRWAIAAAAGASLLAGCSFRHPPSAVTAAAQLAPITPVTRDLLNLPAPKGKVAVAVYGVRDQTGQYKPSPDSSFSTVVTQGASSMLVKALKESGWFIPVERENLQNLLTERKIMRALEMPQPAGTPLVQIPSLVAASVLIEGGIVAYESNVRTGGAGARFLGIGLSTQYRVDQVTVNLRTIDIRGGQVLHSVSTSKTIYSYEIHPSVFKFVNVKDLLELEGGMMRNEPTQLCVGEAIEAGVAHLIVQGLKDGSWALKDEAHWSNPVLQRYLDERDIMYRPKQSGTGTVTAGRRAPAKARSER